MNTRFPPILLGLAPAFTLSAVAAVMQHSALDAIFAVLFAIGGGVAVYLHGKGPNAKGS